MNGEASVLRKTTQLHPVSLMAANLPRGYSVAYHIYTDLVSTVATSLSNSLLADRRLVWSAWCSRGHVSGKRTHRGQQFPLEIGKTAVALLFPLMKRLRQ